MSARLLISTSLLLVLCTEPLFAQREIKQLPVTGTGQGVVWTAKLTRFQKRDEGSTPAWSTPAWRVNLRIKNYTDSKVELGGLLAVIQPVDVADEYAAVYVALHREKDDPSLKMVEERYGFQWGADVEGTMGLWPIARVASGMSANSRFSLMLRSPGAYNFAGGGFGHVSPRSEREIVQEVLFPIGIKVASSKVFLIAPTYRAGKGAGVQQQIFSFDTSKLDLIQAPESEQDLGSGKASKVSRTVASLKATAESETEPVWRRILALNWLAETNLQAAEPVLLALAQGKTSERLQLAAISNLGAWKRKAAVEPLAALLSTAGDAVKASAVRALGEIGDAAAIPAVRPLLGDPKLKPFAVEAVGKLKDPDSVPLLLADVRKATAEDSIPASESLALIATEPVVDGLIAIASDTKAERFARIRAFVALQTIGSPKSFAPAVAALADKDEGRLHMFAVDILEGLMKAGNADARAALTKYAEEPKAEARYQARKALGLTP